MIQSAGAKLLAGTAERSDPLESHSPALLFFRSGQCVRRCPLPAGQGVRYVFDPITQEIISIDGSLVVERLADAEDRWKSIPLPEQRPAAAAGTPAPAPDR